MKFRTRYLSKTKKKPINPLFSSFSPMLSKSQILHQKHKIRNLMSKTKNFKANQGAIKVVGEFEKYLKDIEMTRDEKERHQAIGNMFCQLATTGKKTDNFTKISNEINLAYKLPEKPPKKTQENKKEEALPKTDKELMDEFIMELIQQKGLEVIINRKPNTNEEEKDTKHGKDTLVVSKPLNLHLNNSQSFSNIKSLKNSSESSFAVRHPIHLRNIKSDNNIVLNLKSLNRPDGQITFTENADIFKQKKSKRGLKDNSKRKPLKKNIKPKKAVKARYLSHFLMNSQEFFPSPDQIEGKLSHEFYQLARDEEDIKQLRKETKELCEKHRLHQP
ncbi:unnamed protein product [Moneuplotes crassus]|uniref:Uncharacterized protein n=1 Tax=Euplotes crassus TaxID=5936 RepID=A0AAD2D8L0_EUPCR|nr:unnamed protein product [Moneuplotes crassus]